MAIDKEKAAGKYPGIEESVAFENNKEEETSKKHLHTATDEEIRQSVQKINPDDGTLDRG